MQGADAGRVVSPGLPAARDAEVLQHGLGQGTPEVRSLRQGGRAGHAGGQHDREKRRQRVALSAPTARVGHAAQKVAQGQHLSGGEQDAGPPRKPLGAGCGRGQLLAGIAPQRIHEDALGLAVLDIVKVPATGAPESSREADLEPVGGAVAGALEALGIYESLG